MMQNKNTPEQPAHIPTRLFGIFSTSHLHDLMGRWGAYIVLLASLLITFNVWYFTMGEVTKRAKARFDFRVKTIKTGIYERLQAYEFLLRGGSGLFAASDEVTREDWRTYVTKLQLNQYYPGIQGVGFSKRILPSEKVAHIRQIHGEGFPQYTIKPDGERQEYTSIIFLEPFDWRNQRAFGYDMYSEPTRKEAMIRARDTGIAALSGKVTLLQETGKNIQAGFLMYLPVYHKGEPRETLEQRRKSLKGYIYSPFRMNDFMKGILAEKQRYVNLQIFDGDKPLKKTLLYQDNTVEAPRNYPEGRHFAANQSILEYAGHRWLLSFVSSKYFEENMETGYTNFILLLGITISLLLFGVVWSLTKSRSQAISLANTTLDLEKANIGLRKEIMERKQVEEALRSEQLTSDMYINSLPGLFYVFDEERFIRWNNLWNRITGYSDEELADKYCTDFFEGDDKVLIEKQMLKVFQQGVSEAEAQLVTKDGRRIPYLFTGLRKKLNGKDHLIGLAIDITDRKRAEEEIREKEKLQAIVEIAGTVCHELSQPMHIISGYIEVLTMNESGDDSKYKKLKKIKDQVERMVTLLQKMNTITRYETKAHDSKTKIIDLEGSTERRNSMRFIPFKKTIVTSKSDCSIEGQLFDISKDGLSFWCDKYIDQIDELITLNIHIAETNFNIDNIRCIIVCDSEAKSDEKLNSGKMKRCRMKFEKLMKEQKQKIENFMQNHIN